MFLHVLMCRHVPKKHHGTDDLSYLIIVADYLGWNAPALLAVCWAWTEAIRASGPMFSTAAAAVVQISKMFGGRGLWVLAILHVNPLTFYISDNAPDIAITIAKGMLSSSTLWPLPILGWLRRACSSCSKTSQPSLTT